MASRKREGRSGDENLPRASQPRQNPNSGLQKPLIIAAVVVVPVVAILLFVALGTGGDGQGAPNADDRVATRRTEGRGRGRKTARDSRTEKPKEDEKPKAVETEPKPVKSAVAPGLHWQIADQPATRAECHLQFVVNPPYQSVLQVGSYEDSSREQFPSVFLRMRVDASNLSELLDRLLATELYIQSEANGDIWHNLPGQVVEATLKQVEGDVVGEFSGEIHSVDTGQNMKINGSFRFTAESEEAGTNESKQ